MQLKTYESVDCKIHTQSITLKFLNVSKYQQIDHLYMCDENCSFFSNIHYMLKTPKFWNPFV
jgi:hypothetical protein